MEFKPVTLKYVYKKLRHSAHELQESETRFNLLFEQSPVPLSITSDIDNHQSSLWNEAFLTLFGYSVEQAQGRSANEIGLWIDPIDRDLYIQCAVEQGRVHSTEARLRTADGKEKQVCISGRFITTGEKRLLLSTYEDITESRLAERQVLELNAHLETRIQQRTKELEKSNAELWRTLTSLEKTQNDLIRSEKMAALGALVAGVAHELNTPIGNGLTMASALNERLDEFTQEMAKGLRRSTLETFISELRTGLDILFQNVHRAGELISGFKQVAVDQSNQTRRQFDLASMMDGIILTLRPSFKQLPIRLSTDISPEIEMDSYPGPLGQVMVNLINNARVHAFDHDKQGLIKISADTMLSPDGEASWVQITVRDNGQGIDPDNLPRIFDPFFTTKLGSGGSGLGLNISYNIVTSILGGSIQAFSLKHEGTRMVIKLPMQAPAQDPTSFSPFPAAPIVPPWKS